MPRTVSCFHFCVCLVLPKIAVFLVVCREKNSKEIAKTFAPGLNSTSEIIMGKNLGRWMDTSSNFQ